MNAALPADHALGKVDYVATVVFTPTAALENAKRLAQGRVRDDQRTAPLS